MEADRQRSLEWDSESWLAAAAAAAAKRQSSAPDAQQSSNQARERPTRGDVRRGVARCCWSRDAKFDVSPAHLAPLATLLLLLLLPLLLLAPHLVQSRARETINDSPQVFIDPTTSGQAGNQSGRLQASRLTGPPHKLRLQPAQPLQLVGAANKTSLAPANQAAPPMSLAQTVAPKQQQVPEQQQQQQQQQRAADGLNLARNSSAANSHSLALVRQRWRQMERSVGHSLGLVGGQLRLSLAELLAAKQPGGGGGQVSGACRLALNQLLDGLTAGKLWASQTLDANARLPSGLLEGTLTELGHFDECLAIRYPVNDESSSGSGGAAGSGQYCSVLVRPPLMPRPRLHTICQPMPFASPMLAAPASNGNGSGSGTGSLDGQALRFMSQQSHQFYYAGLRLGVCAPSQCGRADLQHLLAAHLAKYELLGQVKWCQVAADERAPKLDAVQQAIGAAFVALFLLVALATLLDSAPPETRARPAGLLAAAAAAASSLPLARAAQQRPAVQAKRWSHYHIYQAANELPASEPAGAGGGQCAWTAPAEPGQLQRNPLLELAALAAKRGSGRLAGRSKGAVGCETVAMAAAAAAAAAAEEEEDRDSELGLDLERDNDELDGEGEEAAHEEAWVAQLEANQREALGLSRSNESGLAELAARPTTPRSRSRLARLRSLLACFSLKRNLANIGRHARQQATKETRGETPTTATSCERQRQQRQQRQQQQQQQRQKQKEALECSQMDDIKVIHGLRTITMVWIIFGHTVGLVSPEMMNSLFSLAQLSCSSRLLQALLNATLAVNTFFMISGLVTVISIARRCDSGRRLLLQQRRPQAATTATTRASPANCSEEARLAWSTDGASSSSSSSSAGSLISSQSLDYSSSSSCSSAGQTGKPKWAGSPKPPPPPQQAPPVKKRRQRIGGGGGGLAPERATATSFWPNDFKPLVWLAMRYLRLTPAYAATIGLSVLLPALGSGPFWPESAGALGPACRQHWWLNLLYLNNFLATDKLCLIHSWYLSNDWQFFACALLLLGALYKSRRLACLLLISLFLVSTAITFTLTVVNELPPTIVTTSPAIAERWLFIHSLYYKPWPHLPSYLVGLLAGYLILLAQQAGLRSSSSSSGRGRCQELVSARWRLFGWLASGLLALTLLNSVYPWNMGLQVDQLLTGLHSSTFRTLWAACCAWLVFALATKPQNPLARLLSWHGFQLTSRLTYCAYLMHPLIIYYHFGSLRERIDSSPYGQLHRFVATLGLSYLAALLLSLLVEGPSIELQRWLAAQLFGGPASSRFPAGGGGGQPAGHAQARRARGRNRRGSSPGAGASASASASAHLWTASSSFAGDQDQNSAACSPAESARSFKVSGTLGSSGQFSLLNMQPQPHQVGAATPAGELTTRKAGPTAHHSPLSPAALLAFNSAPSASLGAAAAANCNESAQQLGRQSLDADFQRKLAQAISRGFRMRTRIANRAAASTSNSRTQQEQEQEQTQQQLQQQRRRPSGELGAAQRRAGQTKRLPGGGGGPTASPQVGAADGYGHAHLSPTTLAGSKLALGGRQFGEFSTFFAAQAPPVPPHSMAAAAAAASGQSARRHSAAAATTTNSLAANKRQSHDDLTPKSAALMMVRPQTNRQPQQALLHNNNQLANNDNNNNNHDEDDDDDENSTKGRRSMFVGSQTGAKDAYLSSAATNLNELIRAQQKLLSRSQSQTDVGGH